MLNHLQDFQCHNPEDHIRHLHHRENLNLLNMFTYLTHRSSLFFCNSIKCRCLEYFVGIQEACISSDSLVRMVTEIEIIPFIRFVRQHLSTFTQTGLAYSLFLFPTGSSHHLVVLYGDRLDNTSGPHDPIAA
jgi:hypothetical protein